MDDKMRTMEPFYQKLYELFNWENRDRNYCITFTDGRQLHLTDVYTAQDRGEPSHATAEIVDAGTLAEELPKGRTIFFRLSEINLVSDQETGTVLYQAIAGESS
jgi:hypothetical protein